MTLGAVTVHYQNPSFTQRLLRSFVNCDRVQSIVVVSHDSFELQSVGKVLYIQQPNKGYASGLNAGVNRLLSTGVETVLAANPDVILDTPKIELLYAAHIATGAGCTFPVLSENGRLITGYRFSRFGSLLNVQNPEWYSGACFLFSVEAWQKTGGFDESFFHYFEDRDFCLRVGNAGYTIHQSRAVVVEHQGKSGRNYAESTLPKYAVRNHLVSMERSGLLGPWSFLNVVVRHFAYLFRWKKGWRGIPAWNRGVKEFLTRDLS